MTFIFTELKRRNVFKIGIAYGIIAWLLIQVVATVLPMFGAPDWIAQTITFVILLGFPLAVFLAWAYEITPEGVKPTHQVEAHESITHLTGRKFDFIIIGLLALAVIYLLVDKTVLEDAPQPEVVMVVPEEAAAQEAPAPAPEPERPAVLPNSVAVLPLENLSPDPEEAYFATGIHDEILNQLAKLSNVNVIARTSVQQYRDTDKPIPEIAEELNVETVMEGSIRYANGRVRLVAQLIDAESGAHLWSDAYEHEFDDIFAIQADIAMNIANALEAEFSEEEQGQIEKLPTNSTTAYALYLRAVEEAGIGNDFNLIHSYFDQAVELDPDFALAYATQAYWKAMEPIFAGFAQPLSKSREELEKDALEKASRALEIDPNLGRAHLARGMAHVANWDWAAAREEYARAIELSPGDMAVLNRYVVFKRITGEYDESIRIAKKMVELDPLQADSHHSLGVANYYAHNYEDAIAAFRTAIRLRPTGASQGTMGMAQNAIGDHEGAIASFSVYEQLGNAVATPTATAWLVLGYARAGRPEKSEELFRQLEEIAEQRDVGAAHWALAYLARGDEENALSWLQRAVEVRGPSDTILLWEFSANVWNDSILEKPEFRELRNQIIVLE